MAFFERNPNGKGGLLTAFFLRAFGAFALIFVFSLVQGCFGNGENRGSQKKGSGSRDRGHRRFEGSARTIARDWKRAGLCDRAD